MQNPINESKSRNIIAIALYYLIFVSLIFQLAASTVFAQSTPESVIPIGDGPYALDVTADGKSAMVSLLFPAEDDDPNLFFVDLENNVVTDEFRFGRRLFRIGAVDPTLLKTGNGSGVPLVMVNGDLDKLTVADLSSGKEIAQVPTGQNPSNVEVVQSAGSALIGNTTNLAVVTNGTGGSLSFIDLDSLSLVDGVDVGDDPRATATVPNSQYILVVLRAENTVAVLDLGTSGYPEISRVEVGQDPTDIEISGDGKLAVVANLTNNTVSILDISNPANPRVVRDPKTNSLQFPVGVQPTSVAITPDNTTAFIANSGSSWITAVDLIQPAVTGILRIQQPGSSIASASAAVQVTQ